MSVDNSIAWGAALPVPVRVWGWRQLGSCPRCPRVAGFEIACEDTNDRERARSDLANFVASSVSSVSSPSTRHARAAAHTYASKNRGQRGHTKRDNKYIRYINRLTAFVASSLASSVTACETRNEDSCSSDIKHLPQRSIAGSDPESPQNRRPEGAHRVRPSQLAAARAQPFRHCIDLAGLITADLLVQIVGAGVVEPHSVNVLRNVDKPGVCGRGNRRSGSQNESQTSQRDRVAIPRRKGLYSMPQRSPPGPAGASPPRSRAWRPSVRRFLPDFGPRNLHAEGSRVGARGAG